MTCPSNRTPTSRRIEGSQAKAGVSLVASTEVLESIFGKLKRVEGDYAGDGFTELILAVGAFVGERTEERTKEALEAVPKKEAESWAKRVLGTTVQKLRSLFVSTGEA